MGRGIRAGRARNGRGRIERDAGEMDGKEGERQVFMVVEEKRRGSAARAFPDRGTAKPGGADRTTENTFSTQKQIYYKVYKNRLKRSLEQRQRLYFLIRLVFYNLRLLRT